MTEFDGVHDLGHQEKGANSLCSQSEPVSLVLDLALRRAWIWPCVFMSLGNSLNCSPTISSKQQSQHSPNRVGIPGLWVSSANKTVILFAAFLLAAKNTGVVGKNLLTHWVQERPRVRAGMPLIIFSVLTALWVFSSSFSPLKVNADKSEGACGNAPVGLIDVFGQLLICSDLYWCIPDMSQLLVANTPLPQLLQ